MASITLHTRKTKAGISYPNVMLMFVLVLVLAIVIVIEYMQERRGESHGGIN